MRRFPLVILVLAVCLAAAPAVLATGCGKKQTLNEAATEVFRPFADRVGGTTYSFNEPATLTFTFSNMWSELSPADQRTFMNDVGQLWIATAKSHGVDETKAQVNFEDNMGNVFATYSGTKGLKD